MKTLNVADYGIRPNGTECCADALMQLIGELGDSCEIIFPAGVYFLKKRITIAEKTNLTLKGMGATIRTHFCNTDPTGLDGAFEFVDCEALTVKGFTFDMDVSPNIAGTISRICREENWFDVKIFDEFPITGQERLEAVNTVDEEYTPDYRWATYDVVEHTYLGDNTFRFDAEKAQANLDRLYEGLLVNIRHVRYGAHVASFTGVNGCLIEDIRITAAPGCVFVIAPRCSNFVFRRFCIGLPEHTRRIMAANADGIHILGLTGKLEMQDCHFENLGDDALNIHSKAATAENVDLEHGCLDYLAVSMVAVKDPASLLENGGQYQVKKYPMSPRWVNPGDRLYVYDPETVGKLGELRVLSKEETSLRFEVLWGTVKDGDVLANAEYYAATHIDGCTVRNTRARGFLLQTNHVLIENCHIYGMSMSAFLLSPDVAFWYEVGPCADVEIRNNLIEKCTTCIHRSNIGAIVVKCRHEEGITDTPAGTHKHIRIEGNTFRNIGDSGIFALAVDDLQIRNNHFDHCCEMPFDEQVESLKYDVALVNCDHVTVSGNTSTQDDRFALHTVNVTNLSR